MEKKDTSFSAYNNKPVQDWTIEEVADYARNVLNFSEKSAKNLIEQELNGQRLLVYESKDELFDDFKGVPKPALRQLWAEIEKMKKSQAEPENKPSYPALSIESQLQNLTLDTLNEESRKAVQKFMSTPTKTPSKSAIYMTHRYVPNSPLHLPPKIVLDVQQDPDEQLLGIHLLMATTKKPTLPESATNDHTMPFKDRVREAELLRSSVKYNLVAYETNSRRKNEYYFTVVTSGTGFGKTRFCKEIPDLIKSIPETMVTIHLDLSNGDRIQDWHVERDEYLTNSKLYLENLIGRRIAARALWNCNYDELLGTLGQVDSLGLLTFDAVLKMIGRQHGSTSANPVGVLLILDEINYLFKYNKVASAVIDMIGNYMTSDTVSRQRDAGIILFPVISGTAVNGVAESFLSSAFGRQFIPLGLLSLESAKDIFSHCLQTKRHWLNDKRIVRLLLLYGNTPAVLRRITKFLERKVDTLTNNIFDSLIEQLEGEVSAIRFQIPGFEVTHVDVVLAGVVADPTISASFQYLEDDGIVYILNGRYMLPYVYLRAANRVFTSVSPKLLPAPGMEYSWNDFEKLEHTLQRVRIKVLKEVRKRSKISLQQLVAGSYYLEPDTRVRLRNICAVTCTNKLLVKKDDKLDLSCIEVSVDSSTFKIMPANYTRYSFLAAPGNALFDIVEFYEQYKAKQVIAIFKQLKHLEDSENSKTIGPKPIETWLTQMQASTSNLSSDYKCYYMLITNKRVPSASTLVAQNTDLLIVDQSNLIDYYGPTVAVFADLVSLDDTIATNSHN